VKKLDLARFVSEAAGAARLGASMKDKLLLLGCQIAGSLRYRFPGLVAGLCLKPAIRCFGAILVIPIRFRADDWLAFQQVFVDCEYEWGEARPQRILDAGANCGYASLWLAARFPGAEIACVEPHPELAGLIRNLTRRHGLPCTVVEAALSAADGRARLHLGSLSTSHSLMRDILLAGRESIEVECVSMPALLERLQWNRVDLLKLDIEGGERQLLAGSPAWLERVDAMIGELHGDYGPGELAADLRPAGFAVESRAVGGRHLFRAFRDSFPGLSRSGTR
jgi:FkbM family methyltransferase